MSMHNPFRGPRAATAIANASGGGIGGGGGGDAYDSFIDFDGFPANNSSPSYAASSPSKSLTSQSHSTATTSVNIAAINSRINIANANARSSNSHHFTNHDRIASVPLKPAVASVDWPVEEDQEEHVFAQPMLKFELDSKQQQQQRIQYPSRDQQIFRRKGASIGASGSASTQPSYSSSRGSSFGRGGEEISGTNNNNNNGTNGRGSIVFESFEAASNNSFSKNSNSRSSFNNSSNNNNNNNGSRSREFSSTSGSQHRTPSILDDIIAQASRADNPASSNTNAPQSQMHNVNANNLSMDQNTVTQSQHQRDVLNTTFPQSHNAINRRDVAGGDHHHNHRVNTRNQINGMSKSFGNNTSSPATSSSSRKVLPSPPPHNAIHQRDFANSGDRNQSNSMSKPLFGNNSSSSPATSSSSRKVLPSPPPPPAKSSVSISPQSVIRKTPGVVNKLVSMFSNKQQQNNKTQQHQQQKDNNQQQNHKGLSPRSKSDSTNSNSGAGVGGFQQLKQTITSGVVQFHVPPKQQPPNNNQGPQHHQVGSTSTPNMTISTQQQQQHHPQSNHNHNPISSSFNPPAISPARSNAQSSVTGYSGESAGGSSYNPTGWPGTVDKRGSTYAMEPSYSESEGESSASPQRRIGQPPKQTGQANDPASQLMQGIYPTQHYRQNDREQLQLNASKDRSGFSFDGSSAMAGAAELEEWLTGDADEGVSIYDGDESQANERRSVGPIDLDSCYSGNQSIHSANQSLHSAHQSQTSTFERKTGPIDLDDAYERRFDGWNNGNDNNGWREGREESLPNISETKTAADIQLEAALGMTNNHFRGTPPNKSMGSNAGSSNAGSSRSHPMLRNSNNSSDIHLRETPNKSMGSNAGSSNAGSSRSHPMMRSNNNSSDIRLRETPNKSMGSNAGGSNAGSSRSHPMMRSNNNSSAIVDEEAKLQGIDLSGSQTRVQAFRASGRRQPDPNLYEEEVDFDNDYSTNPYNNDSHPPQRTMQQTPGLQTLSEEALRQKDMQNAPPREGASMNFRGYRGFLDKTKDVPNLMDDLESEASTSLGTGIHSSARARRGMALPPATTGAPQNSVNIRASSVVSSRFSSSNVDSVSDVFDGVQEEPPSPFGPMEKDILNVNTERDFMQQRHQRHMLEKNNSFKQSTQQQQSTFSTNFDGENLPYSTQFNPFSNHGGMELSNANVRPSQPHHFDESFGAHDSGDFFDPSLDVSAITRGSADAFSQHEDDEFGDVIEEDYESLPDLSIYTVEPEMVRKMVRAFRKICTSQMEISSSEETMLYDFENLVDTKKAFALFEMRSRIMESDIDRGLERRGGTNVVDDIVLTPYFQASGRVRDAVIVSKAWRDGATPKDVVTAQLLTRRSAKAHFVQRPIHRIRRPGNPYYNHGPQFWLEEVKWLDDTDFMLMRCQSLGAGTMKGFEMFTVGDCQSILLKMTSDNCTQLRRELRSAMVRQIEAEELMEEEIDLDGDENIVAEAEELYRNATVEVKTLSIKLVLADKAFTLVRNRMEKLVETIESFLVQIENEDRSDDDEHTASSSTRSGDDESDSGSYSSRESVDKVKLFQRAKRAELSAEVAVREAILAKQEAEKIKSDKQREIDNLKEKLADMETKSQLMQSQYLSGENSRNSHLWEDSKSFLGSTFDQDIEGAKARKERLKEKFRAKARQGRIG